MKSLHIYDEKELMKKNILKSLNASKQLKNSSDFFSMGLAHYTHSGNPLNITWDFCKLRNEDECFPHVEVHGESSNTPVTDPYRNPRSPQDSGCCESVFSQDIREEESSSTLLTATQYNRAMEDRAFGTMGKCVVYKKAANDLQAVADEHYRVKNVNETEKDPLWSGACKFNRRLLLSRCLRSWFSLLLRTEDVSSSELCMAIKFRNTHGDERLLRAAFSAWKGCLTSHEKAQNWYIKNLLSHTIQQWHQYVVCSREKRYLHQKANLHFIERTRHHKLLEWYQIWIEQNKLRLQSEKADNYQRHRLLLQCFRGWRGRFDYLRQLKTRAIQMQANAARIRLRKILSRWHAYTLRKQRNQYVLARGLHLQKFRQMGLCFTQWQLLIRNQKRRAELIWNHLIHKQSRKSKMILTAWRAWAHARRIERAQAHLADIALREKSRILLLRYSVNHWRQSVEVNHKQELAARHGLLHTLRISFHQWRAWCHVKREKLQMKMAANRFRSVTLQAMTIKNWHENCKESRRLKHLEQLALCRWSLCLQAQAWSAWRLWISHRKAKRDLHDTVVRHLRDYRAKEAFAILIRSAIIQRERTQTEFCRRFWGSDRRSFNLALKVSSHWRFWTRRRLSQRVSVVNRSVESDPRQNYTEFPDSTSLSTLDSNDDKVPKRKSEIPTESNIVVKQSLGAFGQQPSCPEFLMPDLLAKGIILKNVCQTLTLDTIGANRTAASLDQSNSTRQYETEEPSILQALEEIESLHDQLLKFRMEYRYSKLWGLQRRIYHELHSKAQSSKEGKVEQDEYGAFLYRMRKNRKECRHKFRKAVQTLTLYIKGQKTCNVLSITK